MLLDKSESTKKSDIEWESEEVISNPKDYGLDRSRFERMVNGAILDTINKHGPVTRMTRSSASKRIVTTVFGYFRELERKRRVKEVADVSRKGALCYLASPYNHETAQMRELRYLWALEATTSMIHKGIVAYSPIVHNHHIACAADLGRGWDQWKKMDSTMLKKSDCVIVYCLEGWRESIGVTAEIHLAQSIGIPVYHMYDEGPKFIIRDPECEKWTGVPKICPT